MHHLVVFKDPLTFTTCMRVCVIMEVSFNEGWLVCSSREGNSTLSSTSVPLGVSAGHYAAYAKHPMSSDWHYFNDDTVTHQKPQEEDYSNAYILFYQKQGE